jgi:hypothetical protein
MQGAIVVNNVIDGLGFDRSQVAREDHNVIRRPPPGIQLGPHDILRAPRFRAPGRLDYRPARYSPVIDAGSSIDAPARDRRDRRRRDDPRSPNRGSGPIRYVDIGADEYQPRRRASRRLKRERTSPAPSFDLP